MSDPSFRIACLVAPSLLFRAALVEEESEHPARLQERLLEAASRFSPIVEDGREVAEEPESGLGLVRIDARGLGRLHPTPRALLEALVEAAGGTGFNGAVAVMADSPLTAAVLGQAMAAGAAWRGAGRSEPSPCLVSPPGEDRRSLAPLPLHALRAPEAPGLSAESIEKLRLLAVRSAGAFAALPASTVERRFGARGLLLHRSARGEGSRPLRPWRPPPSFERALDLEVPASTLSALEAILEIILRELRDDLVRRRMGATRLELRYGIERGAEIQREIEILDPMAGLSDWLRLLRLDLEARPLPGPCSKIAVRALRASERERRSRDLFAGLAGGAQTEAASRAAPGTERTTEVAGRGRSYAAEGPLPGPSEESTASLERAAARLRARLGPARVGVPALDDRHRPESEFHIEPTLPAFGPPPSRSTSRAQRARPTAPGSRSPAAERARLSTARPPLALRLVPPRAVHVETDEEGRPTRVGGGEAASAGPFPVSGEWWISPYDRLYFEVATSEGLLWIFRDGGGRWYVHGIFD